MLNVLSHGLVADYNPSTNTGTDNTAALNSLIATVQPGATNEGQSIFFPAGRYLFSSSLVGSLSYANGFLVYGEGPEQSVLYARGASSGFALSGTGLGVRDLGFYAVGAAVGAILSLGNCINSVVEHCSFGPRGTSDNFVYAIHAVGLWYCSISDSQFLGVGTSAKGILADYSVNNSLTGCHFENFDHCVHFSSVSTPGYSCQGWMIEDNVMAVCNYAVYIDTGDYVSVLNNVLDFCNVAGINVVGAIHSTFSGNYIGLDNAPGNAGVQISSANQCQLSSNVVSSYAAPGVSGGGYIFLSSSYSTCIGNTATNMSVGLYADGGSGHLTIVGNAFPGCVTGISNASSASQIGLNV